MSSQEKTCKSASLADTCEEATALASCGQGNATLMFPAMDRVMVDSGIY